MSSPAFTARADWTIPRAARELRRRHVKQLPVVGDDGLLTGIVTRSDLLDAFIRSDVEIRGEVEQDVLGRILDLDGGSITVEVQEGVVTLRGHVPALRLVPVVVGLCQGVDVSSPWPPTSPPPGRARTRGASQPPHRRQRQRGGGAVGILHPRSKIPTG
ncbi:CBS domain-containing protein [Streptomyces yangpuensis]|uniref:CBS domain-containing protein n=1 Tax=Streptomyces yangpuensis TaxID=1648182 RepID=UPI0036AF493D